MERSIVTASARAIEHASRRGWFTCLVKKSVDFDFDDHPADDERPRTAWAISVVDDCDGCDDLRVEFTLEEEGRQGTGVT
ncbi:MAG: hypothetical protein JWL83_4621, partial [Actinomycetia bacterium]|nr:hypothetical protein [Actinomycetes bacterium]